MSRMHLLLFLLLGPQSPVGEYVLRGDLEGDEYVKLEGRVTIVSGERGMGASIRLAREVAEFRGGGSLQLDGNNFVIEAQGTAYNQGSAAGECRLRLTGVIAAQQLKGRWEAVEGCPRLTGKGGFTAERRER